jgi:hypothetical protein
MKNKITKAFNRIKNHPNHWVRKSIGVLLMISGVLGFLPVLGFWMFPLGFVLFFSDSPVYWRLRRKFVMWRKQRRQDKKKASEDRTTQTD